MKIIIITDTLDLGNGGVGTCVYDLCKAFLKANNQVLLVGVVNYEYDNDILLNELKTDNCEFYDLGIPSRKEALLGIIKYVSKLKKVIKEWSNNEKTICNVHLKMGVLYGAISSIGLKNVKCVETYHNTYHHYHLQCWALSTIIKKYITVSNTAKCEMRRRFLIPQRKLVSIPNGIDRELIRSSVVRHDLDTKKRALRIITVGRLSYEKNILTAIKAVSELQDIPYEYLVIGDGPQMDEAKRLVGENNQIKLLGKVDRITVLEYLSSADVVIMPSLWEGRSILMLEAAAFDLPFILSDCPGLREPFDENELDQRELYRKTKFGYLVKTNEIEGYKKAIVDFYSFPEYHENMRSNVKKMSIDNDMCNVANAYISIFRSVLFL